MQYTCRAHRAQRERLLIISSKYAVLRRDDCTAPAMTSLAKPYPFQVQLFSCWQAVENAPYSPLTIRGISPPESVSEPVTLYGFPLYPTLDIELRPLHEGWRSFSLRHSAGNDNQEDFPFVEVCRSAAATTKTTQQFRVS